MTANQSYAMRNDQNHRPPRDRQRSAMLAGPICLLVLRITAWPGDLKVDWTFAGPPTADTFSTVREGERKATSGDTITLRAGNYPQTGLFDKQTRWMSDGGGTAVIGCAPTLPFVPGSWTLAVLPDTQVYTDSDSKLDFFKKQTQWIADNRDRFNIKYVLHLGDLTGGNEAQQWARASNALQVLDRTVPYAIVPGNHDSGTGNAQSRDTTLLNKYFPTSKFKSWLGANFGVKSSGYMANTWHKFRAGGTNWLVLALEFGPRQAVVDWAKNIVGANADHRVILITHAYVYSDSRRYDWGNYVWGNTQQKWNPHSYTGIADDTHDGEDLWQELVKLSANFTMVLNGHVLDDGLGRLSSAGKNGSVVHQMLVNYQMQPDGGGAFIRLIEFLPDGRTVQVKAYSPDECAYKTDPQNQFTLTLNPPLPGSP